MESQLSLAVRLAPIHQLLFIEIFHERHRQQLKPDNKVPKLRYRFVIPAAPALPTLRQRTVVVCRSHTRTQTRQRIGRQGCNLSFWPFVRTIVTVISPQI